MASDVYGSTGKPSPETPTGDEPVQGVPFSRQDTRGPAPFEQFGLNFQADEEVAPIANPEFYQRGVRSGGRSGTNLGFVSEQTVSPINHVFGGDFGKKKKRPDRPVYDRGEFTNPNQPLIDLIAQSEMDTRARVPGTDIPEKRRVAPGPEISPGSGKFAGFESVKIPEDLSGLRESILSQGPGANLTDQQIGNLDYNYVDTLNAFGDLQAQINASFNNPEYALEYLWESPEGRAGAPGLQEQLDRLGLLGRDREEFRGVYRGADRRRSAERRAEQVGRIESFAGQEGTKTHIDWARQKELDAAESAFSALRARQRHLGLT